MNKVRAQACGRVNLIGEHTDYNDGWVLPTSIPQKTTATVSLRGDETVSATSTSFEESHGVPITYRLGKEQRLESWVDYIQGVTSILRKNHALSGFNIHIESDIPIGSGLSSSAALEVATLKALREIFSLKISDVELARIGQLAENDFVGAKVGIMDQMACALARYGEALFLDTKTLNYQQIPIDLENMDLLVINSGVAHQHAGGDYNQRRFECEEACRLLGISSLRQLEVGDLKQLEALPETLRKRAHHVITENLRVHQAVEALRSKNALRLGQLFYESHVSMARDYEVSIREIDLLIDLCRQNTDVYGARLTGGGFGGSIVAITKPSTSAEVAQKICALYQAQTSYTPTVLVSKNKKEIQPERDIL